MSEYRLSNKAEHDLREILKFTLNTYGRDQAERYVSGIEDRLSKLTVAPQSVRLRDEFDPPVRIAATGRHAIVFLEQDYGIWVIRILHQSMDFDRHL